MDEDSLQMHLRKGVLFHDGQELTAEDVKYTFDRAMNSTIVKNNFSWLESVDVVDEYTVVINTKGAYTPVLNALCNPLAGIMPKHLLEQNDEAMTTNPVGTGPYKFVERKEGEYVKLEANENYWGGTVATKYLEMRVVPEASQRSTLLETGEIDIAYDVPPSDVDRLNANEATTVLSAPSFKVFYVTINCNSGTKALNDSRVRQAIEYAIDKEALCASVMYGYATPAASLVGPGVFGYDDSATANIYNIEKAKELLSAAGYPDGFSFTVTVPSVYQVHVDTAQVLVNDLAEAGITMNINQVDWATWLENVYTNRDYEATIVSVDGAIASPTAFLSRYRSDAGNNFVNFQSEEFDQHYAAATEAIDEAVREQEFKACEKVLTENAASVYLQDIANILVYDKKFDGYAGYPLYAVDFSAIYQVQ